MKCVCPMGGDRTCPDDCTLAIWAGLGTTDRKAQRKAFAEQLYKQKFTMEQIATQLGVSQQTISNDLSDLPIIGKSKPAKTERNPKGAGRPKGKKKPTPSTEKVQAEVDRLVAAGEPVSRKKLAVEYGVGQNTVQLADMMARARLEVEPTITPESLSLTAQQKLEMALRQQERRQAAQFEQRVRDEVKKRVDEIVLPHWKEQIEQAKTLYERRRGLMDKETFNTIRRALHPDSRNSISDKKLGEAFDRFMQLEKYLLDEKNSPTDFAGLPNTLAEWDQMRARHKAAARANGKRTSIQRL